MTKTAEIKCINKDDRFNPYDRITHVGGYVTSQWKLTLAEAIHHIERLGWTFYTRGKNGHRTNVIVATSRYGYKYLRTEADYDTPDNLLHLPECP